MPAISSCCEGAAALPDGAFMGLERLAGNGALAQAQLNADPALAKRVEEGWMADEGANRSPALLALITGLLADGGDAIEAILLCPANHSPPKPGQALCRITRR